MIIAISRVPLKNFTIGNILPVDNSSRLILKLKKLYQLKEKLLTYPAHSVIISEQQNASNSATDFICILSYNFYITRAVVNKNGKEQSPYQGVYTDQKTTKPVFHLMQNKKVTTTTYLSRPCFNELASGGS
ncbi:hypothetical protein T06_3014 [Trichinella sp. T6]|nr:hypothetical protein T06_3014 [Trichinella sp. T6]